MGAAISHINNGAIVSTGGSFNFGNFNAPSPGLMVVVAMGARSLNANRSVSSVSIGGTNGAIYVSQNVSGKSSANSIAGRAVSSGNQNVTVNFSGNMDFASVAVFLLTGYSSETPTDTDNGSSSGASATYTLDFATNSIAVYGMSHLAPTESTSWPAATGVLNANANSVCRHAAAHKTASGAGNTEVPTWTSSVSANRLAAVWDSAPAGSIVIPSRSTIRHLLNR